MPRFFGRSRRVSSLTVPFLLLALFPQADPARAQAGFSPKVASTVSEVTNHRFADGAPGNLGYKVSTEVLEPVMPGEFLPAVRIAEEDHPHAFEGQWADQGLHAAWVAPRTETQFFPDAYTVESAYLDNYVESDGAPLAPGDRFDMAVKQLPFDTPLNWGRQRGEADGELTWDVATKVHRVSGRYGAHESEMEVMFVRADVVARGGDVDARDGSVDLPPLVVDLPRAYGPEVSVGAVSAQFTPYLHYIQRLEGRILPQAGKAVFTARARGYIPEAREHTFGGSSVREWHIPLDIIITATGATGEVAGRSSASMPTNGVVKTFGSLGSKTIHVPGGSTVITGAGIAPQIQLAPVLRDAGASAGRRATDSSAQPLSDAEDGDAGGERGSLLADIRALAPIDSELAEPLSARVSKQSYDLTVDPDLYGSGRLGVSAHHVRSGRSFFKAVAAPSVTVDGQAIPLDRAHLVELRAVPLMESIRLRFTARGDGNAVLDPSSYARAREGRVHDPGLNLEAVYRLTDDIYAFYRVQSFVEDGTWAAMDTWLNVRSLSGEPHHFNSEQYLESSHAGPFTYEGAPVTNEFTGISRAISGAGSTFGGGASGGGIVTVKRASGALLSEAVADPQISLSGERLAIYLESGQGAHTDYYNSLLFGDLTDVGQEARYALPAVGEHCSDPQVVDDEADSDVPAGLDVRRAWFDYDGAQVYATVEVASLTEAMLSPARYRAGWRLDHIGYGLQAARDATGAWTFDLGLHPSGGAQWSRIATATGKVVYGSPGYIRIEAPPETPLAPKFFDGEIFHDTGAVSYGATTPLTTADSVADRARGPAVDFGYGHGDSWKVAPCPTAELPLQLELVGAPYDVQYTDTFVARARLANADGGLAGEAIVFSFGGETRDATTDADGIAETAFTVTGEPGTYEIEAVYPGDAELPKVTGEVTVRAEDTTMALLVNGTGVNRRLTATLTDADTATSGVGGRTVVFYADGNQIGSAVTDARGVATLDAPPRYRGGKHSFEAVFVGDTFFAPARAAAST